MKNGQIRLSEKVSFSAGLMGQNFIYGLVISYLMIFYTDILGIGTVAVGTIFLVARVWDGVNDPIMGVICDKTRTRWGKFRPYFLFAPFLIGLTTILLFYNPDISSSGKVIYASITYIAWGMAYTICDIPIWSLTSVMTTNPKERVGIISLARFVGTFGLVLFMGLGVQFVDVFGQGDLAKGYLYTAILVGAFAFIAMTSIFFFTKERVPYKKKTPKVKDSFRILFLNKPLLIVISVNVVVNTFQSITQGVTMYFTTYNLGDAGLMTVLSMVPFPFMLIGLALTPLFANRFDKKKLIINLNILLALINIVYFIGGYSSLVFILTISSIRYFIFGITLTVMTTMIADSIDYAEYKYGERLEGIAFSMQSFAAKFSGGIGGFLAGVGLTIVGYVPNVPQTDFALKGIFVLMALVPAIASILAALIMKLYPVNTKQMEAIREELEKRRESIA